MVAYDLQNANAQRGSTAKLQPNLASLSRPSLASSTMAVYAPQGTLSHGLTGTGGWSSRGFGRVRLYEQALLFEGSRQLFVYNNPHFVAKRFTIAAANIGEICRGG